MRVDSSSVTTSLPGKPFSGTPGTTNWKPIGDTVTRDVRAGIPEIVCWPYYVADDTAENSYLLVVSSCDLDPLYAAGLESGLDAAELAIFRKQVALRRLQTFAGP